MRLAGRDGEVEGWASERASGVDEISRCEKRYTYTPE